MNGITNSGGKYQAIIRKSDEYSGRLDELDLSKEVRLMIDRFVKFTTIAISGRFTFFILKKWCIANH